MTQKEYPAIVILDGDLEAKQWLLEKERMIVGRDDDCDIQIPQRQISRQHIAFVRVTPEQYEIHDLESKNGTWVNGARLEGSRVLSDGDEIHVALHVRLRFVGSDITIPVTESLPDVIPSDNMGGRLRLDVDRRRVFIAGTEVDPPLSLPQYRLLELLYNVNGRVITRDEVINHVWPEVESAGVSEQAVDALVRRLRERLAEMDNNYQYITTVRGHGFRLDNPSH
jgi:hypothetical protein